MSLLWALPLILTFTAPLWMPLLRDLWEDTEEDESVRHDTSQRIPGRRFQHCEVDERGRCQTPDHYWISGGPTAHDATSGGFA